MVPTGGGWKIRPGVRTDFWAKIGFALGNQPLERLVNPPERISQTVPDRDMCYNFDPWMLFLLFYYGETPIWALNRIVLSLSIFFFFPKLPYPNPCQIETLVTQSPNLVIHFGNSKKEKCWKCFGAHLFIEEKSWSAKFGARAWCVLEVSSFSPSIHWGRVFFFFPLIIHAQFLVYELLLILFWKCEWEHDYCSWSLCIFVCKFILNHG